MVPKNLVFRKELGHGNGVYRNRMAIHSSLRNRNKDLLSGSQMMAH